MVKTAWSGSGGEVENRVVRVEAQVDNGRRRVSLSVSDNGPGVDESLLPEALFEPMKTTREKREHWVVAGTPAYNAFAWESEGFKP